MKMDVKMRFLTRKNRYFACALFLLFIFLSGFLISCGGGGGGGSGEKGSSKNKPTSNVKGTAIRILHGAIDANPVDLYSSLKEDKLGSSFFAESSFFVSLPSGEQVLKLVRATSLDQISAFPITVEKDSRRTLLLYGNVEKFGLSTNLVEDNRPEILNGMSAFRVAHALIGASAVSATLGDVVITDGTQSGGISSYIEVPAGDFELKINRTVDKRSLFSGLISLAESRTYTFLITGEVDYLIIGRNLED